MIIIPRYDPLIFELFMNTTFLQLMTVAVIKSLNFENKNLSRTEN